MDSLPVSALLRATQLLREDPSLLGRVNQVLEDIRRMQDSCNGEEADPAQIEALVRQLAVIDIAPPMQDSCSPSLPDSKEVFTVSASYDSNFHDKPEVLLMLFSSPVENRLENAWHV